MLAKLALQLQFRVSIHFKQAKSHYEVLGVSRQADENEIKKKFYEMAKVYHPDVCKEQGAAVKFAKISAAYQILSNKQKRKDYDIENKFSSKEEKTQQYTDESFSSRYRSQKRYATKNEQEDYQDFTAYDSYFKKNRKFTKPRRGTDININFSITFEESIKGVTKEVRFMQQQICSVCSDLEHPICFTCGGKGTIYNRTKREKQKCTKCSGRGYRNECNECQGHSFKQVEVRSKVHFQKNTHNRTILRLEGQGHHGFKSINGDLYITVYVEQSQFFKVDGNNIYSEHQIEFLTAVFGGETIVKTVYGEQCVTIEAGTQSGKEIRLFNKGLLSPFSKRQGDHVLTVKIKIPSRLNDRQKILMQELKGQKN